MIDGIETVFLWVNAKYRTEEKEALKPVLNRPGVFVLDSKEEKYGDYYCKLMNPKFCEITEITYFSGWQIETSRTPSIRRKRRGYLGTYRRRFQQQGVERVVEQWRMADERELTVRTSDLER